MARFIASIRRSSRPQVTRLSHRFLTVSIGTHTYSISVDVNRSGKDYEIFRFTFAGNVNTNSGEMTLYDIFELSGNDINALVIGKKKLVLVDAKGGVNENKNVL